MCGLEKGVHPRRAKHGLAGSLSKDCDACGWKGKRACLLLGSASFLTFFGRNPQGTNPIAQRRRTIGRVQRKSGVGQLIMNVQINESGLQGQEESKARNGSCITSGLPFEWDTPAHNRLVCQLKAEQNTCGTRSGNRPQPDKWLRQTRQTFAKSSMLKMEMETHPASCSCWLSRKVHRTLESVGALTSRFQELGEAGGS